MELSISIVSYNTKEILRECLSSIIKHIKGVEYEVIVVDNGSIDGSVEMLKHEFPMVKVIENKRNLFFTRANNQVIRKSISPYILLLNSDTVLIDNSVTEMVNFMHRNPLAGAVSGKVLFPDGRIQNTGWSFHTPIDEILNQEPWKTIFRKKYLSRIATVNTQILREVDVVSDGFMLVRRDAMFKIGLYDERFLLYYTEDDICHRLKGAGFKIYYLPQASVIHKLFGSSKKVLPIKIALIRVSDTLKYCTKYYKFHITIGISLFLLLGLVIELLKLIIKRCRV